MNPNHTTWLDDRARALSCIAAMRTELEQIAFAFNRADHIVNAGRLSYDIRNALDTVQQINAAVQRGRRG
jgi:hypothetical protein